MSAVSFKVRSGLPLPVSGDNADELYRRLMLERHSVRQYLDRPVPEETRERLDAYVGALNRESGLNIQTVYDEPGCFGSFMAKYGTFSGCTNYISLIGPVELPDLDERCGYYGELAVLEAQRLGLNTCWAALSHGKTRAEVAEGEREVIVIALGFGKTPGKPSRSKKPEEVSDLSAKDPDWYRRGIEAALLAPTAINQRKFRFSREGNRVTLEAGRIGPCLKIDLGIVGCHFEIAAGRGNFDWE